MLLSDAVVLASVAFAFGGVAAWIVLSRFRRPRSRVVQQTVGTQTIVERVRAVGKLVGLEVFAKEIATATSGWAWMPPVLLTQARLAMIFHFEKQYTVDLGAIGPEDVEDLGDGRFRVHLPPIQGQLRLLDVVPYDIQAAKVLGLLDLVSMTADRQKDLMKKAQQQASELYATSDDRYLGAARLSVERHLRALMELFGIEVDVEWGEKPLPAPRPMAVPVMPRLLAAAS
jgi:hypothetical protein